MFEINRYTASKADEWNAFVAKSKNGTFLFDRRYMDYYADRFSDHSLMCYHEGRLYAVLPANSCGDELYSHQGLTYGGLIIGSKATAVDVCEAMKAVNSHLKSEGFRKVVCKALPSIYATIPADEPLYAMTEVCHARITTRHIASVVDLKYRLPLTELRRRGKKKAIKRGVTLHYSDNFKAFWNILTENLMVNHHASPVHSLDEIMLLKDRFPTKIKLFAAFIGTEMVAGTVLYITPNVVKTQYISASAKGKEVGALDFLFDNLMAVPTGRQRYFDMGTSAQDHSTALSESLIFQKEGFGGRAVCYDTYEWEL